MTRYRNTSNRYCAMHLARISRHGSPDLKKDSGQHGLEKLPHIFVDKFILEKTRNLYDYQIAEELRKIGYPEANKSTIGYRRRRLGKRKYLRGEIKKHKAWIRSQALKKYGNKCELCGYGFSVDTHHVIPKYQGGPHEIDNLMIVCPNCHSLITRKIIEVRSRLDIPHVRSKIIQMIKPHYAFL